MGEKPGKRVMGQLDSEETHWLRAATLCGNRLS
jgi:hypothetical protein